MKKRIIILITLLCLCLCACSSTGSPTESPAAFGNTPALLSIDYNSYGEFKKAINNDKKLYDEVLKEGANKETLVKFEAFIKKYQSQKVIVPQENGKAMKLSSKEGYANITLFPSERFELPCVFFFPYVTTGENFYIKITCLPDSIVEKQNNLTASEVIRELAPNSPNVNNLGNQHKRIYNQSIKLADCEVVALVIEYKTDTRNSTTFIYNDLLIEVRGNPDMWSTEWFSALSFASFDE